MKGDRFTVLQNMKKYVAKYYVQRYKFLGGGGGAGRPQFPVHPVLKYEVHT